MGKQLPSDISQSLNRTFMDDLKERSFISGKRVRVHSKTSEYSRWERSRYNLSQSGQSLMNNLTFF